MIEWKSLGHKQIVRIVNYFKQSNSTSFQLKMRPENRILFYF